MPALITEKLEYIFSLEEIKSLISKELKVPEATVSVRYIQNDLSEHGDPYPDYQVTYLEVTVDNTKKYDGK